MQTVGILIGIIMAIIKNFFYENRSYYPVNSKEWGDFISSKIFNKLEIFNMNLTNINITHSVTGSDWVYRDGKSFGGLFAKFLLIFF